MTLLQKRLDQDVLVSERRPRQDAQLGRSDVLNRHSDQFFFVLGFAVFLEHLDRILELLTADALTNPLLNGAHDRLLAVPIDNAVLAKAVERGHVSLIGTTLPLQ